MKDILRANLNGFPKMIDWGEVDMSSFPELKNYHGYKFIVMEKAGMSLKDMLTNVQVNFCLVDTLKLGI